MVLRLASLLIAGLLGACDQDKPSVDAAARGVKLKAVGSFAAPIYVTSAPGDRSRLFVVERAGRIRIVRNGRKLAQPFLDISERVSTDGERGLLSMAFPPGYAKSGRFYVYFTDNSGDIRVQEFRRSSADRADAGSARNLVTVRHRSASNHNGGQLQFGPDGKLYAGTGDGGGAGDPENDAQSRRSRLGKLLRIDPRSRRVAIHAVGLRNPWRFSFDRRTGDLVIADVGQNRFEEIDFARRGHGRGANYGWNVFEGRSRYRSGSARGAVRPRVVHSHASGWCSITGGYVVRDRALKGLYGRYVYGDLCKRGIRSVRLGRSGGASGDRGTGVGVGNLVSFGEDARGRVYAVSLSGRVYRFVPR